jgi:hypothetical protein
MRAPEGHFLNAYGKAIVDPRQTISLATSPHSFRHYAPRRPWRMVPPVDECGCPYTEPQFDEAGRPYSGQATSVNVLRINHYYTRSEAEAISKWRKGYVASSQQPPLEQLLDPKLNDIHDDAILRFVPELRAQLRDRQETE